MSWTVNDDEEIQENLNKLQDKQKNLQLIINPMNIIINNLREIQTRPEISYTIVNDKRIQQITKIKPKDKWNNDMTDEYRLATKNECISKINELLDEVPN